MIPQRETAASKLSAESDHLGGDVRGDDASLGPDLAGGGQRRLTVASCDVEDAVALLDVGHLHQTLAHPTGGLVDHLGPLVPPDGGSIPLVALLLPELGRVDRLGFHRSPLFGR
jgi:hypothetical protein